MLSGDLNEDILRPPASDPQSLQRLVSAPTGLQLTGPVNPFTGSELTISIRDGLTKRYDYILPCAVLFSNLVSSQVFRTDLLNPLPPNLYSDDDNRIRPSAGVHGVCQPVQHPVPAAVRRA